MSLRLTSHQPLKEGRLDLTLKTEKLVEVNQNGVL